MIKRSHLYVVASNSASRKTPDYVWYAVAALCYSVLAVVELWGTRASGSLALFADALHVGVDALVMAFSAFVGWRAVRAQTMVGRARTFAYGEMGNGVLLVLAALAALREAIPPLLDGSHEMDVHATLAFVAFTLPVHLVVFFLVLGRVHGHDHGADLKHSASWHALGDIVLSFVVLLSAGVVHLTGIGGWDALLSTIVAAVLLWRGIRFVNGAKEKLRDMAFLDDEPGDPPERAS